MPFRIDKIDNFFYLFDLSKNKYTKVRFKTRRSAYNQAKNYMRYKNELPTLGLGHETLTDEKYIICFD